MNRLARTWEFLEDFSLGDKVIFKKGEKLTDFPMYLDPASKTPLFNDQHKMEEPMYLFETKRVKGLPLGKPYFFGRNNTILVPVRSVKLVEQYTIYS